MADEMISPTITISEDVQKWLDAIECEVVTRRFSGRLDSYLTLLRLWWLKRRGWCLFHVEQKYPNAWLQQPDLWLWMWRCQDKE